MKGILISGCLLVAIACTTLRSPGPNWETQIVLSGSNIGPVQTTFLLSSGGTYTLSGSLTVSNTSGATVTFTSFHYLPGHLEFFDNEGERVPRRGTFDWLSRSAEIGPRASMVERISVDLSGFYEFAPGVYRGRFSYDPRLSGQTLKESTGFIKWSDDFWLKVEKSGALKLARIRS
jgi:hypothetical protein